MGSSSHRYPRRYNMPPKWPWLWVITGYFSGIIYTFYQWGDFLVLITGTTRAISLVFRYILNLNPSSRSHVHQIFNSKIQLPLESFLWNRRPEAFSLLKCGQILATPWELLIRLDCFERSSVERSLDAEFLWKDSVVQNLPDPSNSRWNQFCPSIWSPHITRDNESSHKGFVEGNPLPGMAPPQIDSFTAIGGAAGVVVISFAG